MSTHVLLIVAAADVVQARKDVGEPSSFPGELTMVANDEKAGAVTHYQAGVNPALANKWQALLTVPVQRIDGQMDGRKEWSKPLLESVGVKAKNVDAKSAVKADALAVEVKK